VPGPDDVTHDTLLRGEVQLLQPRNGFRSSLDPVLLAGFVAPPFGRFLDIGCASGALSFLLLAKDALARGVGVEIQPHLAALAERGTRANRFDGRFHVVSADVRRGDSWDGREFDLVVTNPPFRAVGTGVLPPSSEKALAHHEVALSLAEWLDVAAQRLQPNGRLATIFPRDRWPELRAGLDQRGFGWVRTREVLPRAAESPNRILVEARRASDQEVSAESPLVVHDGAGYSIEVRRMLGEAP
jgi:tRNA1Val (adenine37-N6)-methyltransferase